MIIRPIQTLAEFHIYAATKDAIKALHTDRGEASQDSALHIPDRILDEYGIATITAVTRKQVRGEFSSCDIFLIQVTFNHLQNNVQNNIEALKTYLSTILWTEL